MGPGVFLAIVGAILLFAVRQGDSPAVDLHVVGLIFLLAGIGLVLNAQRTRTVRRVVTETEDRTDPARPTHTVVQSVTTPDSDAPTQELDPLADLPDPHDVERPPR